MDETKDSEEMDQWYVAANSSYGQATKHESNQYEILADVKKVQDELMQQTPASVNVEEHISTESMKSDIIKVKKWLTILGLVLGIFLVVAIAAAIIGSLAYTKTTIQPDTSSEIQAIRMGQGVNNTAALANIVSTNCIAF